jgi:hypothetical protein
MKYFYFINFFELMFNFNYLKLFKSIFYLIIAVLFHFMVYSKFFIDLSYLVFFELIFCSFLFILD